MAQVRFDNTTKVYDDSSGTLVAVEEMDLEIADGEFVVFVGPSGCGKTTTLRMLAGLETITEGELYIGDELVNDVAPKNRDIAMVFQNYALYPHKTARENMAYGLERSTDLSDGEINSQVESTAKMMGIIDLLDKKPATLSGGQQQRVATGRAIVREPEVFLFDEPLSNLDAKLRKHMRTELARIHSEVDITSVYVTHDQEEAMTLADRIVILNNGKLQQVGSPKEVYYQPANEFVADFIGSPSMNLLSVELDQNDDGSATLTNGKSFEYEVGKGFMETLHETSDDDEFMLGLRPESIELASDAQDEETINMDVDVVEIIGSDNFLYLDLDGQEFRARTPSYVEPQEGETVQISFDDDDIHLFDRQTGEALVHGSVTHESDQTPKRLQQRQGVEQAQGVGD